MTLKGHWIVDPPSFRYPSAEGRQRRAKPCAGLSAGTRAPQTPLDTRVGSSSFFCTQPVKFFSPETALRLFPYILINALLTLSLMTIFFKRLINLSSNVWNSDFYLNPEQEGFFSPLSTLACHTFPSYWSLASVSPAVCHDRCSSTTFIFRLCSLLG